MDEIIGAWFAQRTRGEALAAMQAGDTTVGPIYDIADAVADPHFQQREVIVEVEDPELGSLPMHNIVPRLSATPGAWRCPAPALGQHTRARCCPAPAWRARRWTRCAPGSWVRDFRRASLHA